MKPVVARKRFGQHFLVDRGIIEAIVAAVAPRAGDCLVEIGPGDAALTGPLLECAGQLTAIEIDRDLAARLRRRFGSRLTLIEGDALAVDLGPLAAAGPLRLVGNLPYNLSSPLLVSPPHLSTSRLRTRTDRQCGRLTLNPPILWPKGGSAKGRTAASEDWS